LPRAVRWLWWLDSSLEPAALAMRLRRYPNGVAVCWASTNSQPPLQRSRWVRTAASGGPESAPGTERFAFTPRRTRRLPGSARNRAEPATARPAPPNSCVSSFCHPRAMTASSALLPIHGPRVRLPHATEVHATGRQASSFPGARNESHANPRRPTCSRCAAVGGLLWRASRRPSRWHFILWYLSEWPTLVRGAPAPLRVGLCLSWSAAVEL
jgi:hypothetical protein